MYQKNDGIELEKIKKDLDFMFLYFEMFHADLILNDFEVQKILNYTPAPINFHIFSDEKGDYYWLHNESQIPKEYLIDILSYLGFPEDNAYVIAMFLIVNTGIKKFVTQTFLNIKFPIN